MFSLSVPLLSISICVFCIFSKEWSENSESVDSGSYSVAVLMQLVCTVALFQNVTEIPVGQKKKKGGWVTSLIWVTVLPGILTISCGFTLSPYIPQWALYLYEHCWGEVSSHSPKFPSAAAESPDCHYTVIHPISSYSVDKLGSHNLLFNIPVQPPIWTMQTQTVWEKLDLTC